MTGTLVTLPQSSQLSSFLSGLRARRVLFFELPQPAAEHAANFLEFGGEGNEMLVFQRLVLPQDHEENLQCVHFAGGQPDNRRLLFAWQKAGQAMASMVSTKSVSTLMPSEYRWSFGSAW